MVPRHQHANICDSRRYFSNYTEATPVLNVLQMEFGKPKISCSETCNIFLWLKKKKKTAGNLAMTYQIEAKISHPAVTSVLVSGTHL